MLVKEPTGRNLKDIRLPEAGHHLQLTDAEEEIAESPEHILDHHQVEL